MDHELSFSPHLVHNATPNQISRTMALQLVLPNTRDLQSVEWLGILYFACVRYKLEYFSAVWQPLDIIYIRIEKMERKCKNN